MTKDEKYRAARARAQRDANTDGFDRGLEWNGFTKEYCFFLLPPKQYRFGHELRCEVVSCEFFDKCQPGHGP